MDIPSSSNDTDSPFNILIDGIGSDYQVYLYNAQQYQTKVEVTVRSVHYNIATELVVGVAGILELELQGVNMDTDTTQLTSGYSNSTNVAFPGAHYTPESHPGLY